MAGSAEMEFRERSPLSSADDYLTHQTLDNHTTVILEDPRWTERFIIEMHDPAGDLMLFTGLGVYPNTQYMDGFAIVGTRGEQLNLRAGRTLASEHQDRFDLSAGPIRFVIEEPMRVWRLSLDDGPHGFSFDLRFRRRTWPYEMPTMMMEREGSLLVGYSHFVQAGEFDGWLEAGGQRHQVAGWRGERDRSWGVRPASARVRRGLHFWVPIQFDDVSFWLWTHEDEAANQTGMCGAIRPAGDHMGAPVPITSLHHDLDVELIGDHRVLRSGIFSVDGADGSHYDIEVDFDGPLLGLVGGGYGGPDAQGTPKGDLFMRHDRWPTTPDALPAMPHTILEHGCAFRCGDRVGRGDVELAIGKYDPMGFGAVD